MNFIKKDLEYFFRKLWKNYPRMSCGFVLLDA